MAGGSALQGPEYGGTVLGKRGVVKFDVKRKHGVAVQARFKARDVEIVCDGTPGFPRIDFAPIRARFIAPKRFEGARYSVSPAGEETYFGLEGHLLPGGDAKGSMIFFSNSLSADQPDCSFNFGKLNWKAHRGG